MSISSVNPVIAIPPISRVDFRLPLPSLLSPFSDWSDKELSKRLAGNFHKYEDPDQKGFITQKSLKQAATEPGRYHLTWEDSRLAQEILGRGALMDKLDKDRDGKFDGKINEQNIQDVINAEPIIRRERGPDCRPRGPTNRLPAGHALL